jgi:hypothetical protein
MSNSNSPSHVDDQLIVSPSKVKSTRSRTKEASLALLTMDSPISSVPATTPAKRKTKYVGLKKKSQIS